MTLIMSCATEKYITLTVDRAKTDGEPPAQYGYQTKYIPFPFGVVAGWGDLVGNRIIRDWTINPPRDIQTFDELLTRVERYVEEVAGEKQANEMGFHVAGFDSDGRVRLHHVFWSSPRPKNGQPCRYGSNDHSPRTGAQLQLLYNGRDDIAYTAIQTLTREIMAGGDTRYDLSLPSDLMCFGDVIARFTAGITPQVRPPFTTFLIASGNRVESIVSQETPLDKHKAHVLACKVLGAEFDTVPRRIWTHVGNRTESEATLSSNYVPMGGNVLQDMVSHYGGTATMVVLSTDLITRRIGRDFS